MTIAAYGRVARIVDVPSQQVTRIIVELVIEAHVQATAVFYGQNVLVVVAQGIAGPYSVREVMAAPVGVLEAECAVDHPAVTLVAESSPELKGGPLAQLAGIWANDKEFQDWILKYHPPTRSRRELAEIATREVCGVTSRKQLDHDDAAKARFNTFIREPFMAVKKEVERVQL